MLVDFSGSAAQVAGNVNAVEAIVRSATWYAIRTLAEEDVPVNHGCFLPVEVKTEAGSFLNPAFPAAVVVGNTETGQRVTDAGARSVGAGTTAANTGRQSGDDEQFHGGWRVGQR